VLTVLDVPLRGGLGDATLATLIVVTRSPLADVEQARTADEVRSALAAIDLVVDDVVDGHWLANGRAVPERAAIESLADPPLVAADLRDTHAFCGRCGIPFPRTERRCPLC
jgi:hypothetical protein